MPFTHIDERSANFIHELWGKFLIYQPGGLPVPSGVIRLAEKEVLEIRNPVEITSSDILADLKRDYAAWANLNTGDSKIDTAVFMAVRDPIPFYEESSSARIRTEINQLRRGDSLAPEKNALLAARLFLALAQEHDAQKNELTIDLNAVAGMEKALLENLTGDDEAVLGSALIQMVVPEDVGAYMTRKRIESWSMLFMEDKNAPDFFVTDSRAVMDQLCDASDDLMPAPGMVESFGISASLLDQLAQSKDPLELLGSLAQKQDAPHPSAPDRGRCSLYLALGVTPAQFWKRFADKENSMPHCGDKNSNILNTLVFHFEL